MDVQVVEKSSLPRIDKISRDERFRETYYANPPETMKEHKVKDNDIKSEPNKLKNSRP